MTKRLLAAMALLATLGLGCGGDDSETGEASVHRERLTLAQEAPEGEYRDSLLVSVASSAAEAGDVAVTKDAIDAVADPTERDTIAAEAAYTLARAGEAAAAREVANVIADANVREQVLGNIEGN